MKAPGIALWSARTDISDELLLDASPAAFAWVERELRQRMVLASIDYAAEDTFTVWTVTCSIRAAVEVEEDE